MARLNLLNLNFGAHARGRSVAKHFSRPAAAPLSAGVPALGKSVL